MNRTAFPSTLQQYPITYKPEWAATARYGVRSAPGGLALVQDFLNTRADAATGVDLLGDGNHANAWAFAAVHAWSARRGVAAPAPPMTDDDAAELRSLRDSLDDTLAGGRSQLQPRPSADVQFATTEAGRLHWTPMGHGWRWGASAISGEILLSQHAETWPRLKQCRNAECRATMYDNTWNNRAVWHNRSTCDPSFTSLPLSQQD